MASARKSGKKGGDDQLNAAHSEEEEHVCKCCPEHKREMVDLLTNSPRRYYSYERVYSVAEYLKFIAGAIAIWLWFWITAAMFVSYVASFDSFYDDLDQHRQIAVCIGLGAYVLFMFVVIPGVAICKFLLVW